MTTYLFLDTRQSLLPNTPHNTRWNLNMNFSATDKMNVQLEEIAFQNLVYPIRTNYDTLVVLENGGASTTTITLTHQNYTGDKVSHQLAIELASQLNTNTQESTTYTVSFNEQTSKLTITGTNDFQISGQATLMDILGIDATGMSSASTNFTCPYPVRLDNTEYVDIISSMSLRNISTNGYTNIMARIYITAPFGTLQTYKATIDDRMRFYETDLTSLELRLIDNNGFTYVLPPNVNIAYTMKLTS